MYKFIISLLSIFIFAQTSFAIDKTSLNTDFFNKFNDEYLPIYINEAIENNHDVKLATVKLCHYEGRAHIAEQTIKYRL